MQCRFVDGVDQSVRRLRLRVADHQPEPEPLLDLGVPLRVGRRGGVAEPDGVLALCGCRSRAMRISSIAPIIQRAQRALAEIERRNAEDEDRAEQEGAEQPNN